MLIFGATANCIPWVYVPEILPLHVRAKGTAVGISANWIWNFFVVMITPTLLNNLEWKGYLIFMCLNFSFVPLVVCNLTGGYRRVFSLTNLVLLLSRNVQSYAGGNRLVVLRGRRCQEEHKDREGRLGRGRRLGQWHEWGFTCRLGKRKLVEQGEEERSGAERERSRLSSLVDNLQFPRSWF
ncbi:hypothetical protein PMIN07_011211 [Paraphaeosphaeria minitans]